MRMGAAREHMVAKKAHFNLDEHVGLPGGCNQNAMETLVYLSHLFSAQI